MDRIEAGLVALRMAPGPAFWEAFTDLWRRRIPVLPLAPDLAGAEDEQALRTGPAAVLDDSGLSPLADALPVDPDLALVVVTSGTTGRPKAVELSRAAVEASARASLDRLGAGAGDRWLCCLPLHHVAGLQVLVRSLLLDRMPIVHRGFDPAAVAAAEGVTMVALVPTMLARLLDAGADVARFRTILLGGAPAPEPLLERARAAGARVVQTYGMTETAGGCVYDGRPLDGVEFALGADDRISLRGPVLMRRYRADPDATAAAFRDGWLRTADIGRLADDGRLEVVGRADDVIVTGGEKVSAAEVSALLAGHPCVKEVAVTSRADEEWGERVVAVVVPRDLGAPPTLEQLRDFVAERTSRSKAPRELLLVDDLPRLPSGKIARPRLQAP